MFCLSCLNRHCFSFMLLHIFLIFFSFIDSMSHWNRLILLPKQFSWYIHIIIVAQFDVYTRLQLLNCDQHVISRKMMMVLVAVWPFIEHCSNFTAASARTTSDWVFFFLMCISSSSVRKICELSLSSFEMIGHIAHVFYPATRFTCYVYAFWMIYDIIDMQHLKKKTYTHCIEAERRKNRTTLLHICYDWVQISLKNNQNDVLELRWKFPMKEHLMDDCTSFETCGQFCANKILLILFHFFFFFTRWFCMLLEEDIFKSNK